MKTKAEILKKYIHESKFLSCLSNEVGNLAIFKAMEEYAKQEACEFAEWINLAKEAYYDSEYNTWVVATDDNETKPIGDSPEVYDLFHLEAKQPNRSDIIFTSNKRELLLAFGINFLEAQGFDTFPLGEFVDEYLNKLES